MILIYAYISRFKNYKNQEIIFDPTYSVSFINHELSIELRGQSEVSRFLRQKAGMNLHLLVGKTGSGKTNLLQMIGAKHTTRHDRKWDGEDDSYFLLYKINEREFFLEICDVDIQQFPPKVIREDPTMPAHMRENAKRTDSLRTVRFSLTQALEKGSAARVFQEVQEYGCEASLPSAKVRDMAMVINGYDIHAFMTPPYSSDRENGDDTRSSWIPRMNMPYQTTSLWHVCSYIRDYLANVEAGTIKKQVSMVLSTHNFADQYPIQLPASVEAQYWTFHEIKRDEQLASFDNEAKARLRKRKARQDLTAKQMFIHDLWADYAKYLRKWVSKIHNYNKEEIGKPGYLAPPPDKERLTIVKRCIRLAEYIDRADRGTSRGLLWQITDDISDITKLLSRLDDKYFTIDTCTIPVVDMVLPEYKDLFEDLFERMEQYIPDDAGIFTECLLPYTFTHLSTGEYQYAKVLGGLEDYLKIFARDIRDRNKTRKLDKIILLDEPEAYMHPELARQFLSRLFQIAEKYTGSASMQFIISTHSPFMLSDVLPEEITRLDIDAQTGGALACNGSSKEYFGANIHTILADSFFLNYTIGEYSRNFLQETYDRLINYLESGKPKDDSQAFLSDVRGLVPHIGDRLIRKAFEIALQQLENL